MPLQNRVQPDGSIIATMAHGRFMGNRGILHNDPRQLGVPRWKHKAWVCCALSSKNRHRTVLAPHSYTELFFLDEAVAIAAGHRPCAECRRADYTRYVDAWTAATGIRPKAPEIDSVLHPARVRCDRIQVTFDAPAHDLPRGTMIKVTGQTYLLGATTMQPYQTTGYGHTIPRPNGQVTVLTPAPSVAALRHGYAPNLHPSAA